MNLSDFNDHDLFELRQRFTAEMAHCEQMRDNAQDAGDDQMVGCYNAMVFIALSWFTAVCVEEDKRRNQRHKLPSP